MPDGAPPEDTFVPPTERVRHTDLGGGVTETQTDATFTTRWLLLDLDEGGREVDADLTTNTDWDLALQRFNFRTNGGAGGPAGVRVAWRDGVTLGDVTQAPAQAEADGGWAQDEPTMDTEIPPEVPMGEEVPTTVISHGESPWYDYDGRTHALTPKERVYFLETSAGAYVAMQIVDYYSPETGDAGYPAFQWKVVDPPDDLPPTPGIDVDASDREGWTYLTLDGAIVTVADESTDVWDLALRRTEIRTNSGVSGPGVGGAIELEAAWDAITSVSTVGFTADTMVPLPGPPGSGEAPGNTALGTWFDYDGSTHTVSPRAGAVFAIRGQAGDYAKLRVHNWADGVYRLELAPIARDVDTRSATIDASDGESWVRYSFRQGALVEVEGDAAADGRWDIAFSRTRVATHSGTSGEGEGGAAESDAAFDAIDVVPGEFAVDEELPLPGAPGSGTYDGNPVLAAWFDYDPATHAVSPRDVRFIVRAADGGFAKLAVTAWADGTYTLDWAYAGAGQNRFGGE